MKSYYKNYPEKSSLVKILFSAITVLLVLIASGYGSIGNIDKSAYNKVDYIYSVKRVSSDSPVYRNNKSTLTFKGSQSEKEKPVKKTDNTKNEYALNDSHFYIKVVNDKSSYMHPEPVIFQIYVYGPSPVSFANVSADVVLPSGNSVTVPFSEGILTGSMVPGTGGYTGVLTDIKEDGEYKITVKADDNNGKAIFSAGFTEDLPPSPDNKEPQSNPTGAFQVKKDISVKLSGYAGTAGISPIKINSLYADIGRDGCVEFSWTVPLNIGENGRYEIRYSAESITSNSDWDEANKFFSGKYKNKGGDTEKNKSCDIKNGGYYFAIRSINESGLKSSISNDYHVVIK